MLFLPVTLPCSSTYKRIRGVLRCCATYFGDLDLDGGVVLGSDESVGGRALAGDVKVNNLLLVVLHSSSRSD